MRQTNLKATIMLVDDDMPEEDRLLYEERLKPLQKAFDEQMKRHTEEVDATILHHFKMQPDHPRWQRIQRWPWLFRLYYPRTSVNVHQHQDIMGKPVIATHVIIKHKKKTVVDHVVATAVELEF